MTPDLITILFVIFTGLVFGSFITLASHRLPLGEDIIVDPSRCPKCRNKLGFKDLWPVFSWVISGGKCRYCSAKISARYPLIECITAAFFLLIYMHYGLTLQAVLLALLVVTLLVLIVADLEHYIIPDEIHYALLPLGLAYRFITEPAYEEIAYGFLTGAGIGLLLHHGYRWLRKREGLGYGDVKFLAIAGLWLGLKPLVPFLFFAGLLGVVFGLLWRFIGRGHIFPFGPALAASLFLCVAFPNISNIFWNIGNIAQ